MTKKTVHNKRANQARSHARTVVRECCKDDDESQWERGKFDPPPPKNPLTDGHQNLCRQLRPGYLPPCKILSKSVKGIRFCACVISRPWHKAHCKVTPVQRTLGTFYRPASITKVIWTTIHGSAESLSQKCRTAAMLCDSGFSTIIACVPPAAAAAAASLDTQTK